MNRIVVISYASNFAGKSIFPLIDFVLQNNRPLKEKNKMNDQNKQQISGTRLILLLTIHAIYIADKQHSSLDNKSTHNERGFLFYVDRFFDKKILDNISENVVASDFQIKSFDILEYDVRKKRDDKPSLLSSFEIIPDDANPDSYDVIHKKIFTINYNEIKFNRYVDIIYNEENVRNIVVESFPVDSVESETNSWFNVAMSWLIQIYEHLGLSNYIFENCYNFFANDGIIAQARQFYLNCLDEYNNKQLEQQNKMNEILEKELLKTDNFSKLLKDIFSMEILSKADKFHFLASLKLLDLPKAVIPKSEFLNDLILRKDNKIYILKDINELNFEFVTFVTNYYGFADEPVHAYIIELLTDNSDEQKVYVIHFMSEYSNGLDMNELSDIFKKYKNMPVRLVDEFIYNK